jgi:hypothetical protein
VKINNNWPFSRNELVLVAGQYVPLTLMACNRLNALLKTKWH